MLRYFSVYKPYRVLSQFSPEPGKKTLKDFFPVPRDVYPIGRLDFDSEGLLLLTNDPSLNSQVLGSGKGHGRTYWVQVEGIPRKEDLNKLEGGLIISVDGKPYNTLPCQADLMEDPMEVPERIPPVRVRHTIPTSWIRLRLDEGKNRQVRRMTAALGYPTLRLIRTRIAGLDLEGLQPSEWKEWERESYYRALDIPVS